MPLRVDHFPKGSFQNLPSSQKLSNLSTEDSFRHLEVDRGSDEAEAQQAQHDGADWVGLCGRGSNVWTAKSSECRKLFTQVAFYFWEPRNLQDDTKFGTFKYRLG